MSRPAHIAPLDAALVTARVERDAAAAHLEAFAEANAAILSGHEEARREKNETIRAVEQIEQAILDLGYVVLKKADDR